MNKNKADSKPEESATDIGDAELRYLVWENPGPFLLLLHAKGFSPWLWHPVAGELVKDYHVIAPCFCSHREADQEKKGLSKKY